MSSGIQHLFVCLAVVALTMMACKQRRAADLSSTEDKSSQSTELDLLIDDYFSYQRGFDKLERYLYQLKQENSSPRRARKLEQWIRHLKAFNNNSNDKNSQRVYENMPLLQQIDGSPLLTEIKDLLDGNGKRYETLREINQQRMNNGKGNIQALRFVNQTKNNESFLLYVFEETADKMTDQWVQLNLHADSSILAIKVEKQKNSPQINTQLASYRLSGNSIIKEPTFSGCEKCHVGGIPKNIKAIIPEAPYFDRKNEVNNRIKRYVGQGEIAGIPNPPLDMPGLNTSSETSAIRPCGESCHNGVKLGKLWPPLIFQSHFRVVLAKGEMPPRSRRPENTREFINSRFDDLKKRMKEWLQEEGP